MSIVQIVWCNDKIDWLRRNRNGIMFTAFMVAMMCLTGPIESL